MLRRIIKHKYFVHGVIIVLALITVASFVMFSTMTSGTTN